MKSSKSFQKYNATMKLLSISLTLLLVQTAFAVDEGDGSLSVTTVADGVLGNSSTSSPTSTQNLNEETSEQEILNATTAWPELTESSSRTENTRGTTGKLSEASEDIHVTSTTEPSKHEEIRTTVTKVSPSTTFSEMASDATTVKLIETTTVSVSEPSEATENTSKVSEMTTDAIFTTQPTTSSATENQPTTEAYFREPKEPEEVVDKFFYELRKNYKALVDPFDVPDRVFSYKIGVGIFSISPEYRLTRCKVYGLSTLRRTSFFSEIRKPSGRQFSGMMHIPNAITKCDLQITFLKFNWSSHLTGHADNGNIFAVFTEDYKTGKVTLVDLNLKSIGKLEFQLPPHSISRVLTNKVLGVLSGLFQPVFERYFKLELSYIAKVVSARLDK